MSFGFWGFGIVHLSAVWFYFGGLVGMVWLVLGFCVWCTIESVCLDVVWFGLRVLNSWGCISGLDFVCRWVGVFGL